MLITILNQTRRNALADLYKNLLNELPDKKNIVVTIPSKYHNDEFSNDFRSKVDDSISQSRGLKKLLVLYRNISFIKFLLKKQKEKKLFFFHENAWMNIIMYLSLLGNHIDYYVWVHDPIAHLGEYKRIKFIRLLAFHTYIKHSKKIMVSYREGKEILIEKYNISPHKIEIIPFPLSKEITFDYIKNDNSIQIKYDFIFFGGIEQYKGVDLLVNVFKNNKLKNKKLLIVGIGKEEENIKNQILDCRNITFINKYVRNEDLAKYIKMSRFVVLPYKTATGSNTVQIANYYGKFVIANKVGCFKEYIKDGQNGMFIKNYSYESLLTAIIGVERIENIDIKKIEKISKNYSLENFSQKVFNNINKK